MTTEHAPLTTVKESIASGVVVLSARMVSISLEPTVINVKITV